MPVMALWILAGAFSLVGLPMVWLARRTFARDRAILGWPRARGVVSSSTLETASQNYRDEDGRTYEHTVHQPIVRYTYTVDGEVLEGDRVARVSTWTDRAAAQACVDRYPAQKEVLVHYDPSDPGTAYLEVHRSTGGVILLLFGGLWLAIAALLLGLSFV